MHVLWDGSDYVVDLGNRIICGNRAMVEAEIRQWVDNCLLLPVDSEPEAWDKVLAEMLSELERVKA